MPNIQSAKKALRQSKRRRAKNIQQKEAANKIAKQIRALVGKGKKEEAQKELSLLYKAFDKSAKTGVIKKNTAARYKSRLARLVSSRS